MSNQTTPNPDEKNPLIAFIWVLVGLAPIVILLGLESSPFLQASPGLVLIGCAICNLLGGFGCLRGVKDIGARIVFGVLLSGFFFALSWGVAILQGCSHSSI